MAEESKTEEKREESKQDASTHEKLDRIASHIDSLHKRMDAYEATDRKDAEEEEKEEEREESKDSRRRDSRRRDAEEDERDDSRKRKDASEEEEEEEERSDRRRDARRRDAEEDESSSEKRESDKEALEKEREGNGLKEKDSKRKDAEEEGEKRHDSQPSWAKELVDRLAAIETHVKDSGTEDRAKFASTWNEDEKLCQLFGDSAKGVGPEKWWPGETAAAYARRIATKYKKHSAKWKDVDLTKITDEATFANVSAEIYNDAQSAAMSGAAAPAGRLQRVEVVDPYSHSRRIEWRGDDDGATWAPFCNPLKIGAFATPKKD